MWSVYLWVTNNSLYLIAFLVLAYTLYNLHKIQSIKSTSIFYYIYQFHPQDTTHTRMWQDIRVETKLRELLDRFAVQFEELYDKEDQVLSLTVDEVEAMRLEIDRSKESFTNLSYAVALAEKYGYLDEARFREIVEAANVKDDTRKTLLEIFVKVAEG